MIVESIRALMRPYLTLLLPTAYVGYIFMGVFYGMVDFKEGLKELSMPTGMILTYHFVKKSNMDTK